MQPDLDRRAKFTVHSIDRVKESQLTISQAYDLFYGSTKDKGLAKNDRAYKREKYGNQQDNVEYWRNGVIIFTTSKINDRRTNDPIYLVLTVTNQEITMSKYLYK